MNGRALLVICFCGLVLRLGLIIFSGGELRFPDEFRFLEEAQSLLAGNGLQFDGRYGHDMPLTAILIAGVLYLSGGSLLAVKVFFAVISTMTIYVIARLAYVLSEENTAALIAGVGAAIYPFFIFYSSLLLSETIFIFFLMLYFLSILKSDQAPRTQGFLAGLSHLTRPTLVYFLPVIWVWQMVFRRIKIRQLAAGIVVFLIVLSPWVVRNYYQFDTFVLNTVSSGHVLWEGNNPWNTTGGVSGTFSDQDSWLDGIPNGLTELEEDEWKKHQAFKFIKENPKRFLENGVKKGMRFWSLWPNAPEYQHWHYKVVSILSFGSVLVLSVLGCILLTKIRREVGLIVLFVCYMTALQVVILGSIRYRLPLEPLMIVIGSVYLASIGRHVMDFLPPSSCNRKNR